MTKNKLRSGKPFLVGALHLPPLLEYPDFPGMEKAFENAVMDLRTFQDARFDAVIIENNYDSPHFENVSSPVATTMAILCYQLKQVATIPIGISILWNDYKTALSIAKIVGADFIRVPVFVDIVETSCGIIKGNPENVIRFRKDIGAESVAILTDIHVKHAKLLSTDSLTESAVKAKAYGSDGIIITGSWTGKPPSIEDIQTTRRAVGDFPIYAGSGVDVFNAKEILSATDGCIISTSLKVGIPKESEVNIKGYEQRVDTSKCRNFIEAVNN